jgi:molybdopterin molybdotransferase
MRFHEIGKKISVENALKLIYSKTTLLGVEEANVTESLGRVARSDIRSATSVPHFDRSAMDGYAVIADDTFGCTQQNPAKLEVVGESMVGENIENIVARGQAIEVATGSKLPVGATAVVKVENTARTGDSLRVFFPATPGENISKVGEDVNKGDIVVETGRIIRPQEIAVLLACGILKIAVARRPRVCVVATGNELIEPQNTPVPGKVFDSNSYSLCAQIQQCGATPVNMGIVRDSFEELKEALELASRNDMVVFTGSTSVGKKDMLPEVVSSFGQIVFRGVSMRPGAPTALGLVNGKQVFLLPGFPVAAMIAFETFVGPAIRRAMGARILDPRVQVEAVLATRVPSILGRKDIVRVKLETDKDGSIVAFPVRSAGSGIISSMTKADGTIEIPENTEGLEKGSRTIVKLFAR